MKNSTSRLDRALIPAIPTWFTRIGNDYKLDMNSNRIHVKALIDEPIAGLAVLVHTGRGNFLEDEEKEHYLKEIVKICHDGDKIVVTGTSKLADAKIANNAGVDSILIFPNRHELDGLQDPLRLEKIHAYHEKITKIHGSGMVFVLYEETGVGIIYTKEELTRLLNIDGMVGIKFALLSNFERYEDMLKYISKNHRETTIFTGEDRMFGESLEKTRDLVLGGEGVDPPCINALIGLGQVLPYTQAFMLKAFDKLECQEDYFKARALISRLARICFHRPLISGIPDYTLPMEPYISNLGIAAAFQFELPRSAIPDIMMMPEERERRGAGKLLGKALEAHDPVRSRDVILGLMKEGLKLETSLKEKYGARLEHVGGA